MSKFTRLARLSLIVVVATLLAASRAEIVNVFSPGASLARSNGVLNSPICESNAIGITG